MSQDYGIISHDLVGGNPHRRACVGFETEAEVMDFNTAYRISRAPLRTQGTFAPAM